VGLVGTEVISQISTPKARQTISIVALQNSKKTLLSHDAKEIDPSQWQSQLANSSTSAMSLPDLTSHLSKLDKHTVVIDNTSNNDVASFYPSFLKAGLSIVTPNKKGFSASLDLYQQILEASAKSTSGADNKPPLVYGESTVGAGLPILSTLKDLLETGDEIHKIEGVLSGTLSYIFNEWSTPKGSSKKFSDIVKIAKEQGYTVSSHPILLDLALYLQLSPFETNQEPHPGDDLSGSDVSRKLTILSRLIPQLQDSLPKGFESVSTHDLTPEPLRDIKDGQEYVDKLPQFDADFDKLNKEAQASNSVLRYVGVIDVEKKEIKASLEK
jgi:homoserine dehydrogenase